MAKHVIRDIRYFESDDLSSPGSYAGELFPITPAAWANGIRIANKLREYRLVLGEFHHIYILFNSAIPEGEIRVEKSGVESWFRYVLYGANPSAFRRMNKKRQEQFVNDATFAVLLALCRRHKEKRKLVERVRTELAAHGEDLEITRKAKETAAYRVVITYKIFPYPAPCVAFIEYSDKKNNARFKKPFLNVIFPEDLLFLADAISISHGTIRIKPRASSRAKLYARDYNVPIALPIADLMDESKVVLKGPKKRIANAAARKNGA